MPPPHHYPGHHPQPIGQHLVFEIKRPEPPLINIEVKPIALLNGYRAIPCSLDPFNEVPCYIIANGFD